MERQDIALGDKGKLWWVMQPRKRILYCRKTIETSWPSACMILYPLMSNCMWASNAYMTNPPP